MILRSTTKATVKSKNSSQYVYVIHLMKAESVMNIFMYITIVLVLLPSFYGKEGKVWTLGEL